MVFRKQRASKTTLCQVKRASQASKSSKQGRSSTQPRHNGSSTQPSRYGSSTQFRPNGLSTQHGHNGSSIQLATMERARNPSSCISQLAYSVVAISIKLSFWQFMASILAVSIELSQPWDVGGERSTEPRRPPGAKKTELCGRDRPVAKNSRRPSMTMRRLCQARRRQAKPGHYRPEHHCPEHHRPGQHRPRSCQARRRQAMKTA